MSEPFEVTDEDELRQAAEIRRRIDQAPLPLTRYEQLPAVPALGSDLAGDDAATAWMTSSHLANATLLMAADDMRALCGLLLPGDRLSMPLFAHYPLLRSILEASALVKWLLESDDRTVRITRMLRTRWSDTLHSRDLMKEDVATLKAMGEYDVDELSLTEKAIAERYARDVVKIYEIADAISVAHSVVKKGQMSPGWTIMSICLPPCASS